MHSACRTVSLQIRNVAEEVRRRLAERARAKGISVQAYLLELIEREARCSRNAEMFDRTEHIRRPLPAEAITDMLRDIWSLRHDVSPYVAAYLALARRFECPLVAVDEHLARASAQLGVTATVPGAR